MDCVWCGSEAVTERAEVTAQGYPRIRCRDCGRQFNERSGGVAQVRVVPPLLKRPAPDVSPGASPLRHLPNPRVQHQANLVGQGGPAACAVGGELAFVQLDQVLGLAARTV
jgi:ribosomal protein S27E